MLSVIFTWRFATSTSYQCKALSAGMSWRLTPITRAWLASSENRTLACCGARAAGGLAGGNWRALVAPVFFVLAQSNGNPSHALRVFKAQNSRTWHSVPSGCLFRAFHKTGGTKEFWHLVSWRFRLLCLRPLELRRLLLWWLGLTDKERCLWPRCFSVFLSWYLAEM